MSQPDYAQAKWTPSPNFWAGFDKRDFIVVHATASGDGATEYVPNFDAASGKSTHYAIGLDGGVVQYVEEKNSAWGNCCASGNSSFMGVPGYNWNKSTVSIENEKHSTDNSTALTDAQYQSLLKLVRDIAKRWNIPLQHGSLGTRGIIYHHDIDPVNKGRCPGTFPYDTFFQDLNASQQPTTGGSKPVSITLNANGCVCDVPFWYMLSENEMELCGPTSVAYMLAAGFPGKGVAINKTTGKPWTSEDIDQWVDAASAAMGFADPKNFPGVSIPDMENLLKRAGLHYWEIATKEIATDWSLVRKANDAGYPVIVTAYEPDVKAWNFKTNAWEPAWSWGPKTQANHVFPIGGYDQNGNPKAMDSMNNNFQGYWPPIYNQFPLHYAVIVQLPFLKPIPSGDPNTWPTGFNAQDTGGATPTPPTPATTPDKTKAFAAEWGRDPTTGIAKAALATYWTATFAGGSLSNEFQLQGKDGKMYTAQRVNMGIWLWDGSAHYYPYHAG